MILKTVWGTAKAGQDKKVSDELLIRVLNASVHLAQSRQRRGGGGIPSAFLTTGTSPKLRSKSIEEARSDGSERATQNRGCVDVQGWVTEEQLLGLYAGALSQPISFPPVSLS